MGDRIAVVLPGGMYGPGVPLLMYAADAAEARGASVRSVEWSRVEELRHNETAGVVALQTAQVVPVLDAAVKDSPGAVPLLVGKSLGSQCAALAADRQLPAIWFTPLLPRPWVVDALRRAGAPFLLVGGTADKVWNGRLARELTPHVLEVEEADHGMFVPGRLAASAAVLGRVATAVEDFLDQVVWP